MELSLSNVIFSPNLQPEERRIKRELYINYFKKKKKKN